MPGVDEEMIHIAVFSDGAEAEERAAPLRGKGAQSAQALFPDGAVRAGSPGAELRLRIIRPVHAKDRVPEEPGRPPDISGLKGPHHDRRARFFLPHTHFLIS